ncbi:MAG: hypothetical protein ACREOH_10725, partial [Candidatus Entotheonellia bacterium]
DRVGIEIALVGRADELFKRGLEVGGSGLARQGQSPAATSLAAFVVAQPCPAVSVEFDRQVPEAHSS